MTKPTVQKLIEVLIGDNSDRFIYVYPILIGNVLEKMFEHNCSSSMWIKANALMQLWIKCGFTKSLQELSMNDTMESKALIDFLSSIFLNEKNV